MIEKDQDEYGEGDVAIYQEGSTRNVVKVLSNDSNENTVQYSLEVLADLKDGAWIAPLTKTEFNCHKDRKGPANGLWSLLTIKF